MILVVLVIALVWIILLFSPSYPSGYEDLPTIKFESFQKFYSINPDRWELKDPYVACKIDNGKEHDPYVGMFYSHEFEKFRFSRSDYKKYKRFLKQLEQNKLENKHMESTSKMLSMVKKDIANMEELAEQQKKQALDNFNTILNNLGGTK